VGRAENTLNPFTMNFRAASRSASGTLRSTAGIFMSRSVSAARGRRNLRIGVAGQQHEQGELFVHGLRQRTPRGQQTLLARRLSPPEEVDQGRLISGIHKLESFHTGFHVTRSMRRELPQQAPGGTWRPPALFHL
jgi:hypothetical protein